MFGLLFGVRNYANFHPVVGTRTVPDDLSEQAEAEFLAAAEISASSWALWSEVEAVDWTVDAVDGRPHRYRRQPDGSLVYVDKALPNFFPYAPPDGTAFEEGCTWEAKGDVFRVERISRREVISSAPAWQLVFDLMARLAVGYGSGNVRLVAWFDI